MRASIAEAEAWEREFKADATRRAVETRKRRREKKVPEAARRILAEHTIGPRGRCFICGRTLTDPPSIERGIGPECWGDVLTAIEAHQDRAAREPSYA